MNLYLAFSGVLHPTGAKDTQLFVWAPILEAILDKCDPEKKISIVITSSRAHQLGWQKAVEYLPIGLRNRVIGCTSAEFARFTVSNNLSLIEEHAETSGCDKWLAIDHEFQKWSTEDKARLVITEGATGLSTEKAQADLKTKLQELLISDTSYQWLIQSNHPWMKQMFIKGMKLRASTVYYDLIANGLSIAEAADNFSIPEAAVNESVKWCELNSDLLKAEAVEEMKKLKDSMK